MSGHSKFANIKHKKEKNDAAKGKIFTVIGREIAVAVKEGGPDPANNSKLRDVIAKAKSNNMPNDTIERGIKKAAGDANSVNYVQNTYEGYGPNGIAIIVETLTDNKNRTAANVRSAFSKGRGNIGTSGCVSFMFQKKGQIIVSKEEYETDPDEFMMIALDAGAEDFVEEDDSYEITTDPDAFGEVREALEKEGVPMASAEVTMIPDNYVTLTDPEDIKNLNRTLDLLDEDDDVQAVYHNWEEESGLEVVSRPEVDVTQIGKGQNFIFTAEVAVKPEVKLGEYKGLDVQMDSVEVADEEVEAKLKEAQEQNAREITVEDRAVQDGDIITLNYAGTVDGVAFDGGTAENQQLVIGSHTFIDNFEEQLIGVEIGGEKDVEVTFPEEYHAPDLAGKAAVFHVEVLGIKEKQLPE